MSSLETMASRAFRAVAMAGFLVASAIVLMVFPSASYADIIRLEAYDANGNAIVSGSTVDVNALSSITVIVETRGEYQALGSDILDSSGGNGRSHGHLVGGFYDLPLEGATWAFGAKTVFTLSAPMPGERFTIQGSEANYNHYEGYPFGTGQTRSISFTVGGGDDGDDGPDEGPGDSTGGGEDDSSGEVEPGGGETAGESPEPDKGTSSNDVPSSFPDASDDTTQGTQDENVTDPAPAAAASTEGGSKGPGEPAQTQNRTADGNSPSTPLPDSGEAASTADGQAQGVSGFDSADSVAATGAAAGQMSGQELSALGQLHRLKGGAAGSPEQPQEEAADMLGVTLVGVPYLWAALLACIVMAAPAGALKKWATFALAPHQKSRFA